MGQIIKGKPVADKLTENVIKEVEMLKNEGMYPKLKIIRVGENAEDLAYEKGALNRMNKCGIDCQVIQLPKEINQEDFLCQIKKANDDPDCHGILVFRPLPHQIDEEVVKHFINPKKDIDCFSQLNVAKVVDGDCTGFPPATPSAVMEILKYYQVDVAGKHAVVIGRSMVVGKPVSMLLLNENATVTICHSKTKGLKEICKQGDILIAAVGRAKMVDINYLKEGAVVIDVGINVDDQGNLCGDVDFDSCLSKVSMITPVPQGVGAVTTSVLAKHVVKACKKLSTNGH